MKKLLVTGANGLVGSSIISNIKIGKECDLRNFEETNKLFEFHKPTHVIHCAGKVGGLGANMNHKGQFFYDNIMINTNVIESARKNNVKKLVSFLSTCVFPDNIEYPITEKKFIWESRITQIIHMPMPKGWPIFKLERTENNTD